MKLLVYPRGFMGFGIGQAEAMPRQADYADLVNSLTHNRPIVDNSSALPFNAEVAVLWKEYVSGASQITSFEFRERIMIAAFHAFGTTDFYSFCLLQSRNPYFSATHAKFMNDTFNFLETGTRAVNVQSWRNIVAIGSPGDNSPTTYRLKEFFRTDQEALGCRSTLLIDAIHNWVSYEGGYSDLINTLAILFGEI